MYLNIFSVLLKLAILNFENKCIINRKIRFFISLIIYKLFLYINKKDKSRVFSKQIIKLMKDLCTNRHIQKFQQIFLCTHC